jgi:ABC-2 type transport system permease protein
VLLAVAAASATGLPGGYTPQQLATYCWASQGLIGVVLLWGFTDLSDRIRTGDVVTDLLRPVHPVASYLATDFGRAAHACLTRFVVPLAVGAMFFDLYWPERPVTYPLFIVAVVLAVLVSFACRYLVNAAAYWILDVRGLLLVWNVATSCCAGLAFPLHFLPSELVWTLWIATPFPVHPPAHGWQSLPVKVAAPPRGSTNPAWRCSRSGSDSSRARSAASADSPAAMRCSPSGP